MMLYVYRGYGIGFDSCSLFPLPNFDWGKNVINFGVDMRSSLHNILIIGKEPTAEAQYSINFSRSNGTFCLSLHYNGSNSFLFANATKTFHSKEKILK